MNEKLKRIWDSIKNELYVPENLDISKLERQLEIFSLWVSAHAIGLVEAVTGFGKTFIAIIAIKRMNLLAPANTTIVIVPNSSLKEDWLDEDYGYINVHKLKNVRVFVVKGYTESLQRYHCNLLVLDEIHRYSREDSLFFSKALEVTEYNFVLGLSGSLNDEEKLFLLKREISVIAEVTQFEAESKGWISESIIYNLGIELDEEDKPKLNKLNETHDNVFKKFEFKFDIANGCSAGKNRIYRGKTGDQWRYWLAKKNGWNGNAEHTWSPKNIQRSAGLWHWAMNARQQFLYNHPEKIKLAKQILEKLNKTSIVFSESTDFVDSLNLLLGNRSEVYHSNINTRVYEDSTFKKLVGVKHSTGDNFILVSDRSKIMPFTELKKLYPDAKKLGLNKIKDKVKRDFKNKLFIWLLTAKALDEGFDYDAVEVGIIASGKGVKRQNTQRTGRIVRAKDDKLAVIVNLYILDSQEEKWLKSRQKGTPKSKINWVTSVNEIKQEINEEVIELT